MSVYMLMCSVCDRVHSPFSPVYVFADPCQGATFPARALGPVSGPMPYVPAPVVPLPGSDELFLARRDHASVPETRYVSTVVELTAAQRVAHIVSGRHGKDLYVTAARAVGASGIHDYTEGLVRVPLARECPNGCDTYVVGRRAGMFRLVVWHVGTRCSHNGHVRVVFA